MQDHYRHCNKGFGRGTKDAVINLSEHKGIYYINRGLETSFTLEDITEKLSGNSVTVSYVDHWTPLDPLQRTRHIAELSLDGKLLYTELRR